MVKVATASAVITYFNMFASLGIPTYGIRACAKVRDDKEKLSKTVQELLIINSITMFLTCIVFVVTVALVPEFAAEKELYIINGIGMVLNMFAITWLYNALEQYAYITVCNMVVKLLSLVLMFLLRYIIRKIILSMEELLYLRALHLMCSTLCMQQNLFLLRKVGHMIFGYI